MKLQLQPYRYPVTHTLLLLLTAALLLPDGVRAECKEFKIVEYEDRVEVVCVGEPLTEAQKKANLDEEKRQEQESQRQRAAEQRRQSEAAAASKAKADAQAADERKKRSAQPVAPQKPAAKNPTILKSF
jgi:cobalamin-dependent methionine synthase I